MNEIPILNNEFSIRLLITLGHFLWQGTVIALTAALATVAFRRHKPAVRYGLLVAALLAMTACPVVTFAVLDSRSAAVAMKPTTPLPAPLGVATANAIDEVALPAVKSPLGELHQLDPQPLEPHAAANSNPTGLTAWSQFAPWAAAAYISVVLILLARLAVGVYGGWRLCQRSEPIRDPELLAIVVRQTKSLGLPFTPVIAWCRDIAVPTVVGVLRPTILLPLSLALGFQPAEVEAILAHELAHIRRYDHLVNLLQRLVEAFLFFHPATWWISAQIRVERENCCDDRVMALGSRAIDYARSLLRVAELAQSMSPAATKPAVAAVFVVGQPSRLRDRIARMLGGPDRPMRLDRGSMLSLVIAVAVAVVTPVVFSFAANERPMQPQSATQVLSGDSSSESVDGRHSSSPSSDRLGPAQAAETDDGWGPTRDGLCTRLVLLTERPTVGKPLRVRFELKNASDAERRFDPQTIAPFRVLRVTRGDGESDEAIGPTYQTAGTPQSIAPGETTVLWADLDLAKHFLVAEPGQYKVMTVAARYPFRDGPDNANVSDVPESNALSIDLEPGDLPDLKAVFIRLRGAAPNGWRSSLSDRVIFFIHSPTGLKKDVSTIQLWFDPKEHPPGYSLGEGAYKLRVEPLGRSPLGFVYLTATERVVRLWPEYRIEIQRRIQNGGESADQSRAVYTSQWGLKQSDDQSVRRDRWQISIPTSIDDSEYARCIDSLKLSLAVQTGSRWYVISSCSEPAAKVEIQDDLRPDKIYFASSDEAARRRDLRLIRKAGLEVAGTEPILLVPSYDAEQLLARQERDYLSIAKHHRDLRVVRRSRFVPLKTDNGYEILVERQEYFGESEDTPDSAEDGDKRRRPAPVSVLNRNGTTVTSAQIVAVTSGREPEAVWKKMQEMHRLRQLAAEKSGETIAPLSGWCTEQETILSAIKATKDDRRENGLIANQFTLSLPEGSGLRAEFGGSALEFRNVENKTAITVTGGTVKLVDPDGIARVTLEGDYPQPLHVTAWADGNGEIVLEVRSKIRAHIDTTTGVPADEQQPPHGAVRYKLLRREATDTKPTQLKMQWIYDRKQLQKDAEEAGGVVSATDKSARATDSSSDTAATEPGGRDTASNLPNSRLVVRLFSDKTGQWTGLQINGDSKRPTLERLEAGLKEHLRDATEQPVVQIVADQRLRFSTVNEVIGVIQRCGISSVEFKQRPIPRGEGSSTLRVTVNDTDGVATDKTYINLWLQVPSTSEPLGERWHDGENTWERTRNWSPNSPKQQGDAIQFADISAGVYRVTAVHFGSNPGDGPAPFGVSEPIRVDDDRESTTTIRLRGGVSLVVRLRDSVSNQPIDHAGIRLYAADGMPIVGAVSGSGNFFDRSDSAGEVRFESIPSGEYGIEVLERRMTSPWERPVDWPGIAERRRIVVAAQRSTTVELPLEAKPLNDDELDRRWPWSVYGRITGANGEPIEGVEVRAHTGLGTLKLSGRAVSDRDGRYLLRFGPGVSLTRNGRPSVGLQAATISVHKPGVYEKNLSRQGNLAMSDDPPLADDAKGFEGVVLPGKPKELDFVMVPSVARASGRLIGSKGEPLADYRVSMTGPELPPSSSALSAGGTTDADGRFELCEIPAHYRYQILIEPPKAEPPWIGWATQLLEFRDPGLGDISARFDRGEFTADRFEIQLATRGVNWKSALHQGADAELNFRGDDVQKIDSGDKTKIKASVLRIVLNPVDSTP